MGRWKIVKPVAACNWILNPSAEIAGNYTGINGGETITREVGGAWGAYCYKIVPGDVDRGIELDVATQDAGTKQVFFVTKDVSGSLKVLNGVASVSATEICDLGGGWTLYQAYHASDLDGATEIGIFNPVNETWYIDGIVFCAGSRLQTYLDGDQPGCRWVSTRHGSASVRDASTRAGGEIYDLEDDLNFRVIRPYGGMAGPKNILTAHVVRPGGSVEMSKIGMRVLVLSGWLLASSLSSMNAAYMALADVVKHDAVPLSADGRPQPVLVQYWGDSRVLQLAGVFGGGLEDYSDPEHGFNMQLGLRFDIAAPFWSDVVETSLAVTNESSITANFVMGRIDGDWNSLVAPTPAPVGGANYVLALAEDNKYLYVGGQFDGLGHADYDYLIRYDKDAQTWDAPWTTAPDDYISTMLFMPNGDLVVGGGFTEIDSVPADYAAIYDGATWLELGGGLAAAPGRIILDDAGVLWTIVGGQLQKLEPGGVWTNVGTALSNSWSTALAITPFNTDGYRVIAYVYVGGTDLGAMTGTIEHLARLQVYGPAADAGTAVWESGGDPGNQVWSLDFMDRDTLYVACNYNDTPLQIVKNAADTATPLPVSTISPPVDNDTMEIYVIDCDPSTGWVYCSGSFVSGTGTDILGLRYRDYLWARIPVTPPAAPPLSDFSCRSLLVGRDESYTVPVIPIFPGAGGATSSVRDNRNLYFGMNTLGTAIVPGSLTTLTATAVGGAETRPIIIVTRSGGVSAHIINVRNRSTGAEIILDMPILDGETIVIDLVNLRITSTYFGQVRVITPQAGSRMASFALLPTGNQIDVMVDNDGATITSMLRYRQQYHSFAAAD